ncbi:MAG: divergent PAP2 family protein [Candidatus Absconditabacterales bacterium]
MVEKFPYFLVPLGVGLFVQGLKIIIDFVLEKTIKLDYLWRSGGFPSVHGAVIGSLCALTAAVSGFDSIEFAICIGIGILIRYDAVNIRQEAGKHAMVLNEMRKEIGELRIELGEITHVKKNFKLLKERLGHTFEELIGGIIIGILLTLVILYIFGPNNIFPPLY